MNSVKIKKVSKCAAATDIAVAVLFLAGLAFIIWKCRFGFGNIDECFYLTIPYRLCQGDGLFAQEWHLSQMGGFLLYPIMKLYLMIFKDMTGIVLTFRYLYTAVQAIVAAFIYLRLRKTDKIGAGVASLAVLLYAPFGIMALSYNSMGIMFLELALVIMATAEKKLKLQQALAGLFFAAAVLCCPYLIVVYALYTVSMVIISVYRKAHPKMTRLYRAFDFSGWLFFTIGAAVLAAAFAGFVLSRATVEQIIAAFPSIMNDSDHTTSGVVHLIKTYFTSILKMGLPVKVCCIGTFLCAVLAAIDRGRAKRRLLYFAVSAVMAAVMVLYLGIHGDYLNYVMFPLNLMAVVCVITDQTHITRRLFFLIWLPGMLYSLCLHQTSNQEFYAISSASSVALVGSLMIICIAGRHCMSDFAGINKKAANAAAGERESGKGAAAGISGRKALYVISAIILAVVVLAQLGTETYLRYRAVFWETMESLDTTAPLEGIESGLYASQYNAEVFETTCEITAYIEEKYPEASNVVYLSNCTWMYLLTADKEMAGFSAWMSSLSGGITEETMDKLMEYYRLNPGKVPKLVYIEPENIPYASHFGTLGEYAEEEMSSGGKLLVKK